jgi:hypothetical protein
MDRRADARLQVDVVVARSPLLTRWKTTTQLGVVAGMDGVGVDVGPSAVALMPDELVSARALSASTPLPMVAEFRVGLAFDKVDSLLASRAALAPGAYGAAPRRYYRLRTDSFVEPPQDERAALEPLPLTRGRPPGPTLTKEHLMAAAQAGGRYLAAHLAASGRFVYQVDLGTGLGTDPDRGAYNIPRHAGVSYYLAQLYGATHDESVRASLERAIDHLVKLVEVGGCQGTSRAGKPFRCVVDKGALATNMGSTALAVVAIAQYRLATGDPRYDETLRALAEWILDLQKPSGLFAHNYTVRPPKIDWKKQQLYFDGEAALALIRTYKVFKDARYLDAGGRALDAIMDQYDFFVAKFFFSEEHWTCIAAEAAWPELAKDRYREFCSQYGAFLRDQQFGPGDAGPQQPDLVGAYSVTPFFVPNNTPVGSRTEAMISAYLLGKHHGRPEPALRRQVLMAVGYLLTQQIRPESDWFSPARNVDGAMPSSVIDHNVRIDFVQHTCSAMLRSIEILADEPSGVP